MKLQIVSDLHLEFEFPELETDKDTILIIAGDLAEIKNIEHIRNFYDYYSSQYRYIIEVLGNHSYYNNNIICGEKYKNEFLINYPNCYLLDNDKITIDNIDILGTILWSDFDNKNYLSMFYAYRYMMDYQLIRIVDEKNIARLLHPDDTYKLCINNKQWLEDNLTSNESIVITHHAPSYQSIHDYYKGDNLNGAYTSNLENFIYNNPQVKLWMHGHMHNSFDYNINQTRVICNPKGYGSENKEFKNNLIITI